MKGISRRRDRAQSTSEYALALALIAVVCIAALTLLGKNINALLASLGGSMPTSQQSVASAAGNTIAAGSAPAIASSAPATVPATAPATAKMSSVGVSMNASTGQIQLNNLDTGTSGKITTSSQGTELAALALQRLVKTAVTDDGQAPDPVSLALIQKLADLGHNMATQQAGLTLPPSKDTSSKAYSDFYYSGIAQTTSDFNQTYDKLQQLIGNNPKYSNIMAQVEDYAGIASSITVQNYIKEYNPVATTQAISQSLRGTNIATDSVNVQFEPADINAAMTTMSKLSK